MADITVEAFNGVIDPSAGTVTLLTSDANTRYVIKDVQVSSSPQVGTKLSINGTKVSDLSGNLTGSEIMDVNSSLTLAPVAAQALAFDLSCVYPNSNTFSDGLVSGIEIATTKLSAVPQTMKTAVSFSSMAQAGPCVGGWMINGDFYFVCFDENSTSGLFKRTGGPNGSQSTIQSSGYAPVCFDGVSKFYWVSSYLYEYNAMTGATQNLGYWGTGSTYPAIAYCAGYVLWFPSYSSTGSARSYNIATGAQSSMSFTNYNSNVFPVTFFDSVTNKIRVVFFSAGFTSSATYTDFSITGGGALQGSGGATFNFSPAAKPIGCSSFNCQFNIVRRNDNYTKVCLVDKDMALISDKVIVGLSNNSSDFPAYLIKPTITDAQKLAAEVSYRLRVTAVKTT